LGTEKVLCMPVTVVPVPLVHGQFSVGYTVIDHGTDDGGGATEVAPNKYTRPQPPALVFSAPAHVLSVGQLQ
jgi:hypothetical protein